MSNNMLSPPYRTCDRCGRPLGTSEICKNCYSMRPEFKTGRDECAQHGSLRRSCPICERDDQITALTNSLTIADTTAANLHRTINAIRAERDDARAEVARLRGLVERLDSEDTLDALADNLWINAPYEPTGEEHERALDLARAIISDAKKALGEA